MDRVWPANLCLYGLQAENGVYIFDRWSRPNRAEANKKRRLSLLEKYLKFGCPCSKVRFCCDTAVLPVCGCFTLWWQRTVVLRELDTGPVWSLGPLHGVFADSCSVLDYWKDPFCSVWSCWALLSWHWCTEVLRKSVNKVNTHSSCQWVEISYFTSSTL